MKKNIVLLLSTFFLLNSCNLFETSVFVEFEVFWEDQRIGELSVREFVTESGETIIIDNMKYVISQIRLKHKNRNKVYIVKDQMLGNMLGEPVRASTGDIPNGRYEISFVFGLQQEFNVENPLLGIPDSFLIPEEFGGGYNFMQLNGQHKDLNGDFQPFEFHVSNAVDTSQLGNVTVEDTSFVVNLGTHRLAGGPSLSIVNIKMDLAEWFKNPNTWNFSELNSDLTTNYDAQIRMKENGQSVFSIEAIYGD